MELVRDSQPDLVRRYVAAGDKLRIEANTIFNLTRQLEMLAADKDVHDPVALEFINQLLTAKVFSIWSVLDDFIYLVQAQTILDDMKKK